jgi:hypothetical protein
MVNAVFSSILSELSWFTPSFPGFFAHVSSMIWSQSERKISKLAQHSGKNTLILVVKYHLLDKANLCTIKGNCARLRAKPVAISGHLPCSHWLYVSVAHVTNRFHAFSIAAFLLCVACVFRATSSHLPFEESRLQTGLSAFFISVAAWSPGCIELSFW